MLKSILNPTGRSLILDVRIHQSSSFLFFFLLLSSFLAWLLIQVMETVAAIA
jgi:hypothetical protein